MAFWSCAARPNHRWRGLVTPARRGKGVVESKELGLIDENYLDDWKQLIAQIVVTRGVQQYFEGAGRDLLMPHSLKLVEDYIKNSSQKITPYNQQMKWMIETG
jgi:hypothetical protein